MTPDSRISTRGKVLFVTRYDGRVLQASGGAALGLAAAGTRGLELHDLERVRLEGVRNVTNQARALKRLGFQVAIDDLGAGVAGLSGFTLFDPEVVKLDISLVRGVDTDTRRQAIIKSMLSLCDQLGILVIAEGVETNDERRVLCELGCNYLQGYLFSRPERAFPQPRW